MQSHQLRFTCVWQTQNETLLKNCSCGAWRACQLTLVRFKLRANKDVLLGICVHDSQAEREALISYGARAKGIIARGDQPQTWAEREKKFKYCWSSRLFEKIKACTPHNLWFDILRSNREISQGLTKQTTLKKHSNKKKNQLIVVISSADMSNMMTETFLAFQAITTREIDLGCRTEEQWTSDCYCQCIIGSACSSAGKQAFNVQRRLS